MKVYVYPADGVIGGTIESREMIFHNEQKVQFDDRDQYGNLGAKLDIVYFTAAQAQKARHLDWITIE